MARGLAPDWDRIDSFGLGVTDLGELASRIGAPISFHRGGRTLFMTGFENGIVEVQLNSGTITSDVTQAYQGGKSAKLVTGAVIGNFAQIYKPLPGIQGTIGVEILFTSNQTNTTLDLGGDFSGGSNLISARRAKLRALTPTGGPHKIQYWGSGGAYVDFLTITNLISFQLGDWNHLKMLLNTVTGNYLAAYFNGVRYNFPANTSCQIIGASVFHPPAVTYTTTDAVAKTVYLDNFAVTIGEL